MRTVMDIDGDPSHRPPPLSQNAVLKKPAVTRRRKLKGDERQECFDRIEGLAKQLQAAIREEMARRKEHWDSDGDAEEEEKWEGKKNEVYKTLEEVADEIKRAVRDRKKEAVLALWSREADERTQRRALEAGYRPWAPPRDDNEG